MNIGIFDSSLGGLEILKDILQELPEYNYVYLADNPRLQYCNCSCIKKTVNGRAGCGS